MTSANIQIYRVNLESSAFHSEFIHSTVTANLQLSIYTLCGTQLVSQCFPCYLSPYSDLQNQ